MNTLNPSFAKSIQVHYYFQKKQMIRFEIFDGDGDQEHHHDPIGYMETTLSQIMASPK